MTTTMYLNDALNGIEIGFSVKPAANVLKKLRDMGFRWHLKKQIWYAKQSEAKIKFAKELVENDGVLVKTKKDNTDVVSELGVQVGDIFYITFGYSMILKDFFVVKSVTKKGVRVVGISPNTEDIEGCVYGPEGGTYRLTGEYVIQKRNQFVKDCVNGDLHVLKKDSKGNPTFTIGNGYTARKVRPDEEFYECHWD